MWPRTKHTREFLSVSLGLGRGIGSTQADSSQAEDSGPLFQVILHLGRI